MEHVTLNLNLLYNSRIGELFLFFFFLNISIIPILLKFEF